MLNMDFSQQVAIKINDQVWLPSPAKGVHRKPLAREDKESGHATSVVSYAPGSSFPTHPHPNGEEIYVLEGTFSDESGDYPAGSYIRNPAGSSHAPYSKDGCVLFVKLEQFAMRDKLDVKMNTQQQPWQSNPEWPEARVQLLHQYQDEQTLLFKFSEHSQTFQSPLVPSEILILSGSLTDQSDHYPALSWIRSPSQSQYLTSADETTVVLLKFGHFKVDSQP